MTTPSRKKCKSDVLEYTTPFAACTTLPSCKDPLTTLPPKINPISKKKHVIDVACLRDFLFDTMEFAGKVALYITCREHHYSPVPGALLVDRIQKMCNLLRIDMISAIKAKVALNQKKYPVDICDGSMEYSHETKITETSGQILTPDIVALNQKKYPVDLCYGSMEYSHETKITETSGETLTPDIALKDGHYNTEKTLISEYCTVLLTILKFSEDRGWESKDNPRNLCLALGSELGKLYKIFLWDDECDYQGGVDKDKLITDENGYILSVRKKGVLKWQYLMTNGTRLHKNLQRL
jgi:hypothetical protein